jgi:hypothetical protein
MELVQRTIKQLDAAICDDCRATMWTSQSVAGVCDDCLAIVQEMVRRDGITSVSCPDCKADRQNPQ